MSKNKKIVKRAGRPTDYDPKFCEMLIEHMAEGFSFESFGAIAKVCEDTLYEWAKVHLAFSEAKKMAFVMNRYKWEENGIASDMNPTIWIFNMKNRFPRQWRDRHEVVQETTHKTDSNNVAELAEKLAEVMKLAAE